jgi:hypothetical protein
MTDRRRYGVIEVRRLNAETYHLTINGVMWSEVEWSASRQAWCVQDAAGQCLTHVEHILGQDRDPETAIKLAKRMIVDGRMPTPQQARQQLREREKLGELDAGKFVAVEVVAAIDASLGRRTMMVRFVRSRSSHRRSHASDTRRPWR